MFLLKYPFITYCDLRQGFEVLRPHASAKPPLSFKELDYGLLKCRLVRRGVVVPLTFGRSCRRDFLRSPSIFRLAASAFPLSIRTGMSTFGVLP